MARITMRNSQKATFAEVFEIYISAVTARGVKDKTIATYKQHFHAISKRLDRQQILDEFRNGQIQVLLTNPHTLAESVSLHSVCHDAIYFEYSYNLVHLLQSKDRIHRLGLPDDQYTQYYYHQLSYQTEDGTWSLGEAVYQRLKEKEQIMLDAIDNHVLEAMPVGFFRFEMSAHKPFLFVGTHFKTGWDSKGMAIPLALGYPIGARAPCWQGNPKGTAFPWQWFPKAAALPWQEESNETGGFVAHDFVCKV